MPPLSAHVGVLEHTPVPELSPGAEEWVLEASNKQPKLISTFKIKFSRGVFIFFRVFAKSSFYRVFAAVGKSGHLCVGRRLCLLTSGRRAINEGAVIKLHPS